jgi:hypothetical protein
VDKAKYTGKGIETYDGVLGQMDVWADSLEGHQVDTISTEYSDIRGEPTRPNPKTKVGFGPLPSTPGFVPFSVSRYRSGTKLSGSS